MKVGAACLPYVQELDRLVRIVDLEAEGDSATSAAARASAWGAWASEWQTRTAARLEKLGRFEKLTREHTWIIGVVAPSRVDPHYHAIHHRHILVATRSSMSHGHCHARKVTTLLVPASGPFRCDQQIVIFEHLAGRGAQRGSSAFNDPERVTDLGRACGIGDCPDADHFVHRQLGRSAQLRHGLDEHESQPFVGHTPSYHVKSRWRRRPRCSEERACWLRLLRDVSESGPPACASFGC